ncbi:MAG: dephospho-CoA kinase [Elusimicrobiales bacterium]|nr:dephospho-CoA kinase [Elusimicrobiales bacterium]
MSLWKKRCILNLNRISKKGKLLIGITGSIGSGKTTFLKFLSKFGVHVISSDEIVNEILTQRYYCSIILARYPIVVDSKYSINRKKLARLIFSDVKAKKFIEDLIHPKIAARIIKILKNTQHKIVAIEVPLLFEVELEKGFDLIVCIAASEKKIIERLKRDRKMKFFDFNLIKKNQLPADLKLKKSDIVVFNDFDIINLKVKAKEIFNVFKLLLKVKILKQGECYGRS